MAVRGAGKKITETVMTWERTTGHPHRFGGTEYLLDERREIGHIHGNQVVDIPFPIKVRDELVAAGRAELHHVLPELGAVSVYLREPEDMDRAIELLKMSYNLALKQKSRG